MSRFSKLLVLQQQIQEYIKHDASERTGSWDWTAIVEDPDFGTEKRLDIYYQAYRLRLSETLENDFPKLKIWLGTEAFGKLAKEYIAFFPSNHFSLRYLGKNFSTFLKEKNLAEYYVEMADFEWIVVDCLDAADAEILKFETLKQIPIEDFPQLNLGFHPSVQLLSFMWNVPEIWQNLDENLPPSNEISLTPIKNEHTQAWLVCRSELSTAFRSVSELESRAIKLFQVGQPVSKICEMLSQHMTETEVPHFALNLIQQWFNENLISNIKI